MKVIKKNKKHLWIECKYCGSILEPNEKDFEECTTKTLNPDCIVIRYDKVYRLIKEEIVRWVFCPVCRQRIEANRKITESYELLGGND